MTNGMMQILINNSHCEYEGTTEMNSNNVLLQQDGAPSHTVKHNQLRYIYLQIEKSPLSSLRSGQQTVQSADLNLVDYAVYRAIQQRVYCDDCLKLWNS